MLSAPHAEGRIGALRVEVRGADATGGRECLVVGVAELVGTATAATAAAFTTMALEGGLPAGCVVAGEGRLPTRELLSRVESFGVRLQEFTGRAAGDVTADRRRHTFTRSRRGGRAGAGSPR
jgi:hypothetical protein